MYQMRHLKVEQVMTKNVMCVIDDDSIQSLIEKFKKKPVHSFPVLDGHGKLVGLVAKADLLKMFKREHLHNLFATNVKDIMRFPPVIISPEKSLSEALELMWSHDLRALPVVEEQDLVGLITQADIATKIFSSK